MKLKPLLTVTLTTICGWLLVGNLPVHGGVFSARDYGAVGDDQTDNTEAFSKCLKAVVADGGGQMYLPAGVYRGRIEIPPVSPPIPSWITVEIVGEGEPTPVFGTVGSFPLRNKGTVVKCLAESGAAVVSAGQSADSLYGGFSAVYVVVRNLEVRTRASAASTSASPCSAGLRMCSSTPGYTACRLPSRPVAERD